MKRPLIIANWKMRPGNSKEAFDLAKAVAKGVEDLEADVVLCPPFVYISDIVRASSFARQQTSYGGSSVALRSEASGSKTFGVGGQDCFWEQEGPYTGEVSPVMLRNLGCTHVILGHSERKRYLNETAEMVNAKIKAVLQQGLIPVVCVDEPEQNLELLLKGISQSELKNSVLVYEPAWAISTSHGQAATPKLLKETAAFMKKFIPAQTPILYGGSVESRNIKSFLGPELGQGVLVGGASLQAKEFVTLVKNASIALAP
ncbi:MAG: triosephosphate isomerase (TIM) [Parcubacteria group bacterium Greene0714_21]|nr:MAG: triosephosphate isomerase (TIM) [Parcubacteria group bacterium Greene0416_39]TSC97716.1 MAG: triosephosphate isomerase (TIM) [Parcubacteria group bacterium Greene1014_47]TSD04361.1 MAG: triosephosphate isomerase (TIM) [Parcubacteria group bacterium Greene0714_21]